MSTLTAAERNKLKTSDFALPKERAYPIHNIAHARDALSRVAQSGSPDDQAKVRAAVHKRYPKLASEKRDLSPNEAPGKKSPIAPQTPMKKSSQKPDWSALGSG